MQAVSSGERVCHRVGDKQVAPAGVHQDALNEVCSSEVTSINIEELGQLEGVLDVGWNYCWFFFLTEGKRE